MVRWEMPILILIVMLTHVMSNLLSGFRVVLESIRKNPAADCIERKRNITGWKQHTIIKTKEHHNRVLSLKSPDMFQTSNLTEG